MPELLQRFEREELTEISLTRVMSHVEKRPFAILTAFRGKDTDCVPLSKPENRLRNSKLENDIRSAGFGFEKLIGTYDEDAADGTKRRVTEESFMIIGRNADPSSVGAIKGFAKKMGQKYDQDCIFFKEPANKQGVVIGTKGKADECLGAGATVWPGLGVVAEVGTFHANRLSGIFSALKVKNNQAIRGFKFEAFEHPLTVTEIWVRHLMKKHGK